MFFGRMGSNRGNMARQPRKGAGAGGSGGRGPRKNRKVRTSDYFTQPGKRGAVVVLRKPIGNRATAKVCGVMPSRVHAKMLINALERAESVVKDLFMEATDDGIEALEAVLAACCREVMEKGPKVPASGDGSAGGSAYPANVEDASSEAN